VSLLIIRCPLKPFAGSAHASPSDGQDDLLVEQFEWCLLEDGQNQASEPSLTGVGTAESMPYADEALVLMPTLDVRLIEAKVPLANAKKLQQILPNLIEDFVLTGVESISAQALPPIPGNPALQRTLALTDRAWLQWLTKQLERLLAPRVRLVPECLIFDLVGDGEQAQVFYERSEDCIIFSRRTELQLGVSWIERQDSSLGQDQIVLPQALSHAVLKEISWEYLAKAAQAYLLVNSNSRSANFALNLLPVSFRRDAKSLGSGAHGALSSLTGLLRGKPKHTSTNSSGLSWTDPLVWRQPLYWLRYCTISMAMGFVVYLSWLSFDDWRWSKRMELLAAQNLTPSAIALLNQSKAADSPSAVLKAFIKQATVEQRRRGAVSDADFGVMAAKLQQLKAAYGPEVLQKIDYDGDAITFEFKPGAVSVPSDQVLAHARSLGLAVTVLAPNRYRLEPYAGLGSH
jgi:Type II secretion system (T2SS), protein L